MNVCNLALSVVAWVGETNGSSPPCSIIVGGLCPVTKLIGLDCWYNIGLDAGVAPTIDAIVEEGMKGEAGLLYKSVMSVGPKKSTIALILIGNEYL